MQGKGKAFVLPAELSPVQASGLSQKPCVSKCGFVRVVTECSQWSQRPPYFFTYKKTALACIPGFFDWLICQLSTKSTKAQECSIRTSHGQAIHDFERSEKCSGGASVDSPSVVVESM